MSWKTEFTPDYGVPDWIASNYKDDSWHNNLCPSFILMQHIGNDGKEAVLRVWVEHWNPSQRGAPGPVSQRFFVTCGYDGSDINADCAPLLLTDDEKELADWINKLPGNLPQNAKDVILHRVPPAPKFHKSVSPVESFSAQILDDGMIGRFQRGELPGCGIDNRGDWLKLAYAIRDGLNWTIGRIEEDAKNDDEANPQI